jgi:hypothetical protein
LQEVASAEAAVEVLEADGVVVRREVEALAPEGALEVVEVVAHPEVEVLVDVVVVEVLLVAEVLPEVDAVEEGKILFHGYFVMFTSGNLYRHCSMKGGAKVVIEPHRFGGVFIARGKEDALCTLNLNPGKAVYGEKLVKVDVRTTFI